MASTSGTKIPRVPLHKVDALSPLLEKRKVYVGSGKRDYVPLDDRPVVRGSQVEPLPVLHSG